MANYEATRYDFDGANLTGIEGTATGTILPWSSGSIPTGFLECDGSAVSQSTYAALYAVIGTTYGDPGGGNFNLPDLRDNVPIGKSGTKNLAQTGGANSVTVTGNIGGSVANTTLSSSQIASHSHSIPQYQNPGMDGGLGPGGQGGGSARNTANAGGGGSHGHNLSANFSGDSASVLQPYLVLIYIIKT